jgi:hypothetical protein
MHQITAHSTMLKARTIANLARLGTGTMNQDGSSISHTAEKEYQMSVHIDGKPKVSFAGGPLLPH